MITGFQFQDLEDRIENLEAMPEAAVAAQELAGLVVLHFPVAFPEVFLRDRSGFDVILGNPPWEKPKVEEHGFCPCGGRFAPPARRPPEPSPRADSRLRQPQREGVRDRRYCTTVRSPGGRARFPGTTRRGTGYTT